MTNNNNEDVSKKQSIKSLPIAPGIIIICSIILVLSLGVYLMLAYFGLIETSEFVHKMIFGEEPPNESYSILSDEIKNRLLNQSEEYEYGVSGKMIDWDLVSINSILSNTSVENYYQIADVTYIGNTKSNHYSVIISSNENSVKYEITSGNLIGKYVESNSNTISIYYRGEKQSFDKANYLQDNLYFENEVGCPSIEKLKNELNTYSDDDYVKTFELSNNESIFRITFINKITGNKEIYVIKAGTGIILKNEIYNSGSSTPYYSFETTAIITNVD